MLASLLNVIDRYCMVLRDRERVTSADERHARSVPPKVSTARVRVAADGIDRIDSWSMLRLCLGSRTESWETGVLCSANVDRA